MCDGAFYFTSQLCAGGVRINRIVDTLNFCPKNMRNTRIPKTFLKKLFSLVICSTTIFVLYNITVSVDWKYTAEFDYDCRKNGSEPLPNIIHYCIRGPKIFFTETSESKNLTFRQACAVESTARHNPSISVAVLMTSVEGIDYSNELIRGLLSLHNVAIQTINVDVFLYGTPLWQWYRTGQWRKSRWKISHLSDALRFFIVWHYGGMYLDLDIVTLRSMEHLQNSVITQDWVLLASGMLIFEKGHTVLKNTIDDFSNNYDPNNFGYNGPGAIARNIQKYCDIEDFAKVSGAECNVTILPPETAFPVEWFNWEQYFKPSKITNIASHFNSSYLIHVWNKYSKEGRVEIGKGSLYETAIKEHCPIVYEHAQKYKYI